jgi:hypothetical protein
MALWLSPGTAAAQGPWSPVRFDSIDEPPAALVDLRLSDPRPPNYGLAGGLIGAAVGAVLGGLAGHAVCGKYSSTEGDSCVGTTVAGGLVGAAIAGLVGYGFGREKERHPSGATPEAADAP